MLSTNQLIKISDTLQPADIVLVADNTVLSRTIRRLEGGLPVSHAVIAGGNGTIWTTSATQRTTWKPPFKQHLYGAMHEFDFFYEKTKVVIMRMPGITPQQQDGILKICQAMTGDVYPIGKLIKAVWGGLVNLNTTCVSCGDYDLNKPGKICTEGVADAYLYGAGVDLNPKAHNTNPSGYDLIELYYSGVLKEVYDSEYD